LKLFEVCRLRDIPIVTFVNKMDRESRDPFEILDEVEQKLALDTAPMTWPIGRGEELLPAPTTCRPTTVRGSGHPGARRPRRSTARNRMPPPASPAGKRARGLHRGTARWRSRPAGRSTIKAFLEGHLTPVFFRLGAPELRRARPDQRARATIAPPPRDAGGRHRAWCEAADDRMTAFVFKIQANMDPNHRDRIAFVPGSARASSSAA
jgi:peptide chain release factor 3